MKQSNVVFKSPEGRVRLAWVFLFTIGFIGQNIAEASSGNIRVGLNMPVDEVWAGSTYKFPNPVGVSNDGKSIYQIDRIQNLLYVDSKGELPLTDVGGKDYPIYIMFRQDRVSDLVLPIQTKPLTIEKTLDAAKRIHTWFEERGFRLIRTAKHLCVQSTANGCDYGEVRTKATAHGKGPVPIFILDRGEYRMGVMLEPSPDPRTQSGTGAEIKLYTATLFLGKK